MSFVDDIATDCELFDGTQTVTLRQVRGDSAGDVTVNNVTTTKLSRRQLMVLGGADLNGSEMSFSLNSADVGTSGVERGDQITDEDGALWTVLSTDKATVGTRWLCVCRKQ